MIGSKAHIRLLCMVCAVVGWAVCARGQTPPASPPRLARVTSISFEGNKRFPDETLRAEIALSRGDSLDAATLRAAQEAIARRYRQAGYPKVKVELDAETALRTGALRFVIREGEQVRVRKIQFEGNATFPEKELKRLLHTKTAWWIIRTGAFDVEQVEGDVLRVQSFYRDMGFLDAQVRYRTEPTAKGLAVVFVIEEGTRYRIESIAFQGNAAFSDEELLAKMQSRVGEVVRRRRVEQDAQAIQDAYGRRGYIYATVQPVQVFSERPGYVRLTLTIHEGSAYRVGRVVVRGNTRTRDKVARRALNLYPPDDWFDMTEVRAAEQRLQETRVFSSAKIYPVGDAPDRRDVVIDVKEAEKAGDFLFGLGVTSNSGLVGNVVLDLQNFDITDWPRNWSELFKLRSFFGGGQRLRLELQPGTDLSRFRLDFSEPYFRDRPVRLDVSTYLFNRGRDGYMERRAGINVSFGKRFERGAWTGWSGELAFRLEDLSVRDVDLFASSEIRDDEGSNLLASVKVTMVRDRTDNRFLPTRGDRLRFAYEQFGLLGGDHIFGKLTLGYNWYRTLRTDFMDRKTVLQLKAEGGAILGDAPVPERFFAGGTGSIRGFAFRGVGERDGIDDNNIGGDYLVLLGAEYSYPLIGENVRGLLFLDSGIVGSGAWRASLGAGVRFTLDILNGVPIELDLAAPVSRGSGDDVQVFSFLIGGIF